METALGFNLRLAEAINSCKSDYWLAGKLELSKSAVSQWKKDATTSLKAENLFILAEVSGFSVRWLLFAELPKKSSELILLKLPAGLLPMIKSYLKLSKGVQAFICSSIDSAVSQQSLTEKAKQKPAKEPVQ